MNIETLPHDHFKTLEELRLAYCPMCGKLVSLTTKGFLRAHHDPATGDKCDQREPND